MVVPGVRFKQTPVGMEKEITIPLIWSLVSFRGMLRRPKPTDSEADLLREQEQFLTSGAPSAANVVRRPDKRRGEAGGGAGEHNGETEGSQRDVVTIEGENIYLLKWFLTDLNTQ